MNRGDYLITDVRGQTYMVNLRSQGHGFLFAPCAYIGRIAMFSSTDIVEVVTAKHICLIDDEPLIRDIISIHVRLDIPIEAVNTN